MCRLSRWPTCLLLLVVCLPASVLQETRVWQAGGSAERAARGKCWIEGECLESQWLGLKDVGWMSQDDVDEAYHQLGVGHSEAACLARARFYNARCGNNNSVPILASFVPSGAAAFFPVPESAAHSERNWQAVYGIRRRFCSPVTCAHDAACPASLTLTTETQGVREHGTGESLAQGTGESQAQGGWGSGKDDDAGEWVMNRLVGLADFDVLRPEVAYLHDIGYCLNHDAMYKWAVVMRTITLLQRRGTLPVEGLRAVDVGGGSAPLQYFVAEHGHVTNIDINFLSSWFPTDAQVYHAAQSTIPTVYRVQAHVHALACRPTRVFSLMCLGMSVLGMHARMHAGDLLARRRQAVAADAQKHHSRRGNLCDFLTQGSARKHCGLPLLAPVSALT